MKSNPYEYQADPAEANVTPANHPLRGWWTFLGRLAIAYLLGIVACVVFTPVQGSLAGRTLWPLYPLLAVPGVLALYLYLKPHHLPFGAGAGYWLMCLSGLTPLVLEVTTFLTGHPKLPAWRSWWWGFPIGFLGTLGVYYGAASSI